MPSRKKLDKRPLEELVTKYRQRKDEIEKRLGDFSRERNDQDIYAEMVFCMLTPQSKARQCWSAVEELKEKNLLLGNDLDSVKNVLRKKVRFHNNKAAYVVGNKNVFIQKGKFDIKSRLRLGDQELRLWLIKNIKGYGWKEASHFLRNIGRYDSIAILDRHILLNLWRYGIIEEVPKSLTPKKYLEIEEKMKDFCRKEKIPMSHLDLLFWSEETGEIFK